MHLAHVVPVCAESKCLGRLVIGTRRHCLVAGLATGSCAYRTDTLVARRALDRPSRWLVLKKQVQLILTLLLTVTSGNRLLATPFLYMDAALLL